MHSESLSHPLGSGLRCCAIPQREAETQLACPLVAIRVTAKLNANLCHLSAQGSDIPPESPRHLGQSCRAHLLDQPADEGPGLGERPRSARRGQIGLDKTERSANLGDHSFQVRPRSARHLVATGCSGRHFRRRDHLSRLRPAMEILPVHLAEPFANEPGVPPPGQPAVALGEHTEHEVGGQPERRRPGRDRCDGRSTSRPRDSSPGRYAWGCSGYIERARGGRSHDPPVVSGTGPGTGDRSASPGG
jgi:hypothetical protein